MYYVSDRFCGRVDVVPGLCYVETEFVCVWWFPILPRRSVLFVQNEYSVNGWQTFPIRLSLKSVFAGYCWPICTIWALFGVFAAVTA